MSFVNVVLQSVFRCVLVVAVRACDRLLLGPARVGSADFYKLGGGPKSRPLPGSRSRSVSKHGAECRWLARRLSKEPGVLLTGVERWYERDEIRAGVFLFNL